MSDAGLLFESRFTKGSYRISIDHRLPWEQRVDAAVFPLYGGGSLGTKLLVELAEAGGPALMSALSHSFNSLHTLEPGKAIMVPAGGLPCKFIILAGIPHHCSMEDLENIISSCLMLAELAGLKRVAVPVGHHEKTRLDTDTMVQTMLNCVEVFLHGGLGSLKEVSLSTLDLFTHTNLIRKSCYLRACGWEVDQTPLDLAAGARLAYFNGRDVLVRLGNIMNEEADALVTPSSPTLSHCGSISRGILDAAGDDVQKECTDAVIEHGPYPPGSIVITGAGSLACRHIMHMVTPASSGITASDILEKATDSLLKDADDKGVHCLAMSGFPQGKEGIPADIAAELIQSHVRAFMHKEAKNLKRVVLCDEDADMVKLFITTALDI